MITFIKKIIYFFIAILLINACSHKVIITQTTPLSKDTTAQTTSIDTTKIDTVKTVIKKTALSPFEQKLIKYGLVNVQKLDSSIKVELKYSTTDNFMHRDLYGNFNKAYLQKDVAEKLVKAQHYLKKNNPDYSLIIYDAARPLIVQQWMWDSVQVPDNVRYKYLSNPKYGSLHNYGAAVDVSIINDSTGKALDMATPFDCFCKLAYPYFEKRFLKNGKLSKKAYENRMLLRTVMHKAGFSGITTEWWHFNSCSRKEAQKRYPLIKDFSPLQEVSNTAILNHENKDTTRHKIYFRIQIKISKHKLSPHCPCFKGLRVWEYYHKGYHKYTAGKFKDLNKAIAYRNKLRKLGFKDCFVAAFDNNTRISFKDAYKLMEE